MRVLERATGREEGLEGSQPLSHIRRLISYPSSCEAAFWSYKNHNTWSILTWKWLKCAVPASNQPVSALTLWSVEVNSLGTHRERIQRSEGINRGTRWRSAVNFAPRPSYSRERTPPRNEKDCVGSRAGLDDLEKSKISCPMHWYIKTGSSHPNIRKRYELPLKS